MAASSVLVSLFTTVTGSFDSGLYLPPAESDPAPFIAAITALIGCDHQTNGRRHEMSAPIIKSDNQKAAEADVDGFRKNLGPFVVAAETTRMAMVFTDAKESRQSDHFCQ